MTEDVHLFFGGDDAEAVAYLREQLASAGFGPSADVGGAPHLPHSQFGGGLREVRSGDDLLDPLSTDAEHLADLSSADQLPHVSEGS